jgi:leucyl aminopeptidase
MTNNIPARREWRLACALSMGVSTAPCGDARKLRPVTREWWATHSATLGTNTREWLEVQGFNAAPGTHGYAPNDAHGPGDIWFGVSELATPADFSALSAVLPPGDYCLASHESSPLLDAGSAALGWALGQYRFASSHAPTPATAKLYLTEQAEVTSATHKAGAIYLARDLVNMPAQDLSPVGLAAAARNVATSLGAEVTEICGDDLIEQGFPAVHAVGRAAAEPPRLIDIHWGDTTHPAVTLVGKGVCFDTGGINLKSMAGMRHMKRDMGGAAVMLGLGALIISEALPVRLRILLPIVENAIAEDAMRPGDLIATRDGATIEIENTDCEGRIILADALTAAVEADPELIIDCATLTGSARTAFGGEIQALFASNDELGAALQAAGKVTGDAVWAMPLWAGYQGRIAAPTGDLLNMAPGGYAGAITAGLFLQHFARDAKNWAHFDISAWNDSAKPGHPVGGEATGLSAIFEYVRHRFA